MKAITTIRWEVYTDNNDCVVVQANEDKPEIWLYSRNALTSVCMTRGQVCELRDALANALDAFDRDGT